MQIGVSSATILAVLAVLVCAVVIAAIRVTARNVRVAELMATAAQPYIQARETLSFDSESGTMVIVLSVANTGRAPAILIDYRLLVLLDGCPAGRLTDSAEGTKLNPRQETWFAFRIRGQQACEQIMRADAMLELVTKLTYCGLAGQEQFLRQRDLFEPQTGEFLTIKRYTDEHGDVAGVGAAAGPRPPLEISFERPSLSDRKTTEAVVRLSRART